MLGIDYGEFFLIAVVALLVVGPKDLPKLMRTVGHWAGRARGMARHLRSGFDTVVREAEIEEMNRRWAKQNADIMKATAHDTYIDPYDTPPPPREDDHDGPHRVVFAPSEPASGQPAPAEFEPAPAPAEDSAQAPREAPPPPQP